MTSSKGNNFSKFAATDDAKEQGFVVMVYNLPGQGVSHGDFVGLAKEAAQRFDLGCDVSKEEVVVLYGYRDSPLHEEFLTLTDGKMWIEDVAFLRGLLLEVDSEVQELDLDDGEMVLVT